MARFWFIIAAILSLAGTQLLGQGIVEFRTMIAGRETRAVGAPLVRGTGTLTLSGGSLSYDISVPISRNFPVEAHFHGPAVGGENPIFSLAAYERTSSGIRYLGVNSFDRRWLQDIREGEWYINLHNPEYDNAVMSGFIVPIPEPGGSALLAGGGAVLAYAAARARKR